MPGAFPEELLETFNGSFDRCKRHPKFFDVFYDRFLASSPEVREIFDGVDLDQTKKMVRDAVYLIMMASSGAKFVDQRLERLGAMHDDMGIGRDLYATWLETLLSVVKQVDPQYDVRVEESWRAVMQFGIDKMCGQSAAA